MAFEGSKQDLWSALRELASVQVFAKDAMLFERGAEARGIHLILSGQVQLWMPAESGAPGITNVVGAKSVLGLSESICGTTHKLSAKATLPAETAFIARPVFLEVLQTHHEFCMDVVRTLSEDLHGLYHRFQSIAVVPNRGRRPLTGT